VDLDRLASQGATDLERWAALAAAATPGPWRMDRGEDGTLFIAKNGWGGGGPNLYRGKGDNGFRADPYYPQDEADGEFIAAAREAVPELIQRVRRLERIEEAAYRLTHSRGSGHYVRAFDDLRELAAEAEPIQEGRPG
jgi:hypothetical protein